MITRASTLRSAAYFWRSATRADNIADEESADAPTRIVWLAAGVVGAGVFFGSFGFLAMPFIAGWSWVSAGVAFIAAQYASQILLDLHEYWVKAASFLWIGKQLITRKDVYTELRNSQGVWSGKLA